ncbi:hypothetical protein GF385_01750, partial [Candidatus Dependentiae bacterium]|nr:hypothetical protein [Candidatus Dependentiae bacterium]
MIFKFLFFLFLFSNVYSMNSSKIPKKTVITRFKKSISKRKIDGRFILSNSENCFESSPLTYQSYPRGVIDRFIEFIIF